MKPVNVKSNTYIDSSKEINDKDYKFKIGDIVRISKYKNILTKIYTPNSCGEVFVIKKVTITLQWIYFINDFNGEKIAGTFYENVIKRKDNKLYNKWKGCSILFNSWIDR